MPPSSPKNSLFKLGLVQRKTAETTAAELEAASKARAEKERRDLSVTGSRGRTGVKSKLRWAVQARRNRCSVYLRTRVVSARTTILSAAMLQPIAIGIGSGISLR